MGGLLGLVLATKIFFTVSIPFGTEISFTDQRGAGAIQLE